MSLWPIFFETARLNRFVRLLAQRFSNFAGFLNPEAHLPLTPGTLVAGQKFYLFFVFVFVTHNPWLQLNVYTDPSCDPCARWKGKIWPYNFIAYSDASRAAAFSKDIWNQCWHPNWPQIRVVSSKFLLDTRICLRLRLWRLQRPKYRSVNHKPMSTCVQYSLGIITFRHWL